MRHTITLIILTLTLFAGYTAYAKPNMEKHPEIKWDELMPADWQPEKLMAEYDATSLDDADPKAMELMEKIQTLWKAAPAVPELDGKDVTIAGFVVPVEMDGEEITEFLLVPYYGACIHVPPPPANQTIHVTNSRFKGSYFDTVWVSGKLTLEFYSSDLAEAGYKIDSVDVSPYIEPVTEPVTEQ